MQAIAKTINHLLPSTDLICFSVANFLSAQECATILNTECGNNFCSANDKYPPSYRNNARIETNNIALSNKLFKKARSYIPSTYHEKSTQGTDIAWQLHALNSRIRYCQYSNQEFFSTHKDGIFYLNDHAESKLTFIIYLNGHEEFKNGRTLFFKNQNDAQAIASYTPNIGDLIIFDHNIWHSGEVVTNGRKYILRTDIIYSNSTPKNLDAHKGYVWSSCALPNDELATAGRDKTIRVWNKSMQLQQVLSSHEYSVLDISANNQGDIFSVSRDGHLIKWQKTHGHYHQLCKVDTQHPTALSISIHKNNLIITTGSDGIINYWNNNCQLIGSTKTHSSWVWKTVVINNKTIASCSESGGVNIIDIKTKQVINKNTALSSPVRCLYFNKHSQLLYAGCNNGEILELTIDKSIEVLRAFKVHTGIVRDIACDQHGNLISCGEDNQVKSININDGSSTLIFEHNNFVTSLLSCKEKLISTSYDSTIVRHVPKHTQSTKGKFFLKK